MTTNKRTAEETVIGLLADRRDATSAEIASAAKLGRSTVTKALAKLEMAGKVTRTAGSRDGARRQPDRWTTNPRRTAPTHATPPTSGCAQESSTSSCSTTSATSWRRPGKPSHRGEGSRTLLRGRGELPRSARASQAGIPSQQGSASIRTPCRTPPRRRSTAFAMRDRATQLLARKSADGGLAVRAAPGARPGSGVLRLDRPGRSRDCWADAGQSAMP